jgi:hypothetical protein
MRAFNCNVIEHANKNKPFLREKSNQNCVEKHIFSSFTIVIFINIITTRYISKFMFLLCITDSRGVLRFVNKTLYVFCNQCKADLLVHLK